jgi:hypothetical protein
MTQIVITSLNYFCCFIVLVWFRLAYGVYITSLSTVFQLYRGVLVEETGAPEENNRPVVSH